jgi:hypothetical protein
MDHEQQSRHNKALLTVKRAASWFPAFYRRLHGKVEGGKERVERALETLTGALFQRPPLISAGALLNLDGSVW